MKREEINLLCERFKIRLGDRFSVNHLKQPFFPHGTAQEVFRNHKTDLRRLLQHVSEALLADAELLVRVVHRILESLSNVLAIVLMDRELNDTSVLNLFLRLILHRNNQMREIPVLTDSELPISHASAESLFLDKGDVFYATQLRFCAIVLQGEKEVKYLESERCQCPLPYLGQRLIGAGSFGEVWEVEIERHHMRSTGGDSENRNPVLLARKDFRINREQAFQEELKVLRNIMHQPQRHNHVVTVLAILQHGTTYSLFFPLATCDLSHYFDRPRDPPAPQTLDEKRAFYHRGVALAGALAFLHHGFSNMSCYHLDLKPRNILVYDADTPDEKWKITDFGLSRVRVKANSPNDGDSTMATGVEGTYLAPECAVPGGKVSALSDVWSFGCIFSLVLTFMMRGRDGIHRFSAHRALQPQGDYFYINPKKPLVSPAVTEWFDQLKEVSSKGPFPRVMSESLDFLHESVLRPRRKERMEARKIEMRLMEIWASYSRPESPPLTAARRRASDHTPSRFSDWIFGGKKRKSVVSLGSAPQALDPGSSTRGSRFSPEGDVLVSFSSNQNQIWDVPQMRAALKQGRDTPGPLIIRIPAFVNCISVSSNYVCNGLDGNCFECYIYPVTGASTSHQRPGSIFLPDLGSIKMIALSSDGVLAAFVITQEPGGTDQECLRYLCKTEELIHTAGEGGHPSPPSSRSNSAISTPSLGSMTTRSATNRLGPAIGSAADIRFFGFTSNGQFLIMVTQENTVSFRIKAWETHAGTLYRDMLIRHMGSSATTATHFTACVAFVLSGVLGLVILSQEQYLIYVDLSRKTWKSRELQERMVYMQRSNDNQTLVFLTRDRRHIYGLPISGVLASKPTLAAKISSSKHKGLPSMVLRNNDGDMAELLLATPDGSFSAFDVAVPD